MYTLTFIYSSNSVETLKNVFAELRSVFGSLNIPKIDDIFYYGVFCKPESYAFFKHWEEAPDEIEIPPSLSSACAKPREKIDFVKRTIQEILKGEIEKPEWMKYIEEEEVCGCCNAAPPTFLMIIPKEEKYRMLSERIIEFLYSPNMMITELK